jgi:hypothetical protein
MESTPGNLRRVSTTLFSERTASPPLQKKELKFFRIGSILFAKATESTV